MCSRTHSCIQSPRGEMSQRENNWALNPTQKKTGFRRGFFVVRGLAVSPHEMFPLVPNLKADIPGVLPDRTAAGKDAAWDNNRDSRLSTAWLGKAAVSCNKDRHNADRPSAYTGDTWERSTWGIGSPANRSVDCRSLFCRGTNWLARRPRLARYS